MANRHNATALSAPSRRSFIANTAAVATGIALASGTAAASVDPDADLLAKFHRWQEIDAAIDANMDEMGGCDEARHQLLFEEINALEKVIADTPAQTIVGIALKLQILAPMAGFRIDSTGDPSEIFGAKLVEDAGRLAGLAPRSQSPEV